MAPANSPTPVFGNIAAGGEGQSITARASIRAASCAALRGLAMKVLVVGGGGREHALCWAIAASPAADEG
jgi:hypothetical protein